VERGPLPTRLLSLQLPPLLSSPRFSGIELTTVFGLGFLIKKRLSFEGGVFLASVSGHSLPGGVVPLSGTRKWAAKSSNLLVRVVSERVVQAQEGQKVGQPPLWIP
jgi:hypothetical protein